MILLDKIEELAKNGTGDEFFDRLYRKLSTSNAMEITYNLPVKLDTFFGKYLKENTSKSSYHVKSFVAKDGETVHFYSSRLFHENEVEVISTHDMKSFYKSIVKCDSLHYKNSSIVGRKCKTYDTHFAFHLITDKLNLGLTDDPEERFKAYKIKGEFDLKTECDALFSRIPSKYIEICEMKKIDKYIIKINGYDTSFRFFVV